MKKILLSGGSGFIGKNILESFLSEKYTIVAPRRTELDLIDADSVNEFFADKEFDIVIHSAVKPGHRNAKDCSNLLFSNLRMFQNLEFHNDKYGKFINLGSGAVYNNSKDISDAKEEDLGKSIGKDEHSFCKYVVHKQIAKLENFVDLNIFGIFGKYEDWQIRFISNAICRSVFDLPITINQNRRFSYLFIEDLMPILEFFIENNVECKSYNIVPDEKTELLELAKIIREISNKDLEIQVKNEGLGMDYTGNNSRLKNEFGDVRFTKLKESIGNLYNYYDKNKEILNKELL